jgi:hypothetical protein
MSLISFSSPVIAIVYVVSLKHKNLLKGLSYEIDFKNFDEN